jgi:AcrR family transcriptional regulator
MSTMEQKRKTKRSKEKAEAILNSAMEEFLIHGYSGTNMDAIATGAGVSKATVYSYFQDKEGLFTALIEQLVKKRFRIVLDPQFLLSFQGEPKAVLREVIKELLENISGDQQLQDFLRLMIGESGRFPELARAYINHIIKPVLKTLSQYLGNHPELEIKDTQATVRVLMGSLAYFVILQEILGGKDIVPFDRDRLIDTLMELIIDG